MLAFLVGAALSVATVATVWLMGTDRRVSGYWLGAVSQVFWILYVTLLVYQPALLLLQVPLLATYVRHLVFRPHTAAVEPTEAPPEQAPEPAPRRREQPTAPVVVAEDPFAHLRELIFRPFSWETTDPD